MESAPKPATRRPNGLHSRAEFIAWYRNGDGNFCHELFYTEYIPRIDSALTVPYSIKAPFAMIWSPTIFANPTTRAIIVANTSHTMFMDVQSSPDVPVYARFIAIEIFIDIHGDYRCPSVNKPVLYRSLTP
jgi:hypothetical protein